MFARTTPILLAGACAVAIAGASVGIGFSDSGEDLLRVGYLAAITLAVVGLAGALLIADRRRRLVGLARVDAEQALGRLTALEASDLRSALRIVFDFLSEEERWGPSFEGHDLQEELSRRVHSAALRAEEENIVMLRWAISFLLSAGAVDEAKELASRMSQIYERERLGKKKSWD